MNGIRALLRSRVVPWLWVPVLWVLACRIQITPVLAVAAPFLALPIAGYLGRRLGRIALVVVGLGSLPFLFAASYRAYQIGGQPSIFVVSLVVCAIASKGDAWRNWIPDFVPNRWFYSVLAVLLFVVTWRFPRWEGFEFRISTDFVWVYCLLLMLAGFRRVPGWPLFSIVICASAAGLAIEALVRVATAKVSGAGAVGVLPWSLTSFVDYPSALLCAVAYYGVGRNYEQMLSTRSPGFPSWRLAALLIVGISVLAAGLGLDRILFPKEILNARGHHLHLFGESLLLPLAGLCGGLWLRRKGVSLVATIAATFWFVPYNIDTWFEGSWSWRYSAELGDLITVLVSGWVGIRLRDDAIGGAPLTPTRHWVVFLSATLAVLGEHLLPEEVESFEQLWPLIGAFSGIVTTVLVIAWWRRRRGWPPKNRAGWIALLALVPLVHVGIENAGGQWNTLKTAADSAQELSDLVDGLPALLLVVAYGWSVVTAVKTALREAGEWCRDLSRGLRVLTHVLGMKSLAARIEKLIPSRESAEGKPGTGPRWRELAVRCLGYAQWGLAFTGAGLLAGLIYMMIREF